MIINACRLDKQKINKYLQIIVTILLIKVNMDIGNVLNATKIEEVKSLLTPYWHLAASLHSMKPFHSLINLFKLKQWIFYSSTLLGHISILHILKAKLPWHLMTKHFLNQRLQTPNQLYSHINPSLC